MLASFTAGWLRDTKRIAAITISGRQTKHRCRNLSTSCRAGAIKLAPPITLPSGVADPVAKRTATVGPTPLPVTTLHRQRLLPFRQGQPAGQKYDAGRSGSRNNAGTNLITRGTYHSRGTYTNRLVGTPSRASDATVMARAPTTVRTSERSILRATLSEIPGPPRTTATTGSTGSMPTVPAGSPATGAGIRKPHRCILRTD